MLRPAAALFSLVLVAAACGGRSDDDDNADDDGAETTSPDGGGGAPAEVPGFDGTTIRVGAITPTSGTASVIGNPLTAGNQAYFDALNAEGGVAGEYQVELVVEDSAFATTTADAAYEATKDEVVMFAQILGTQIVTTLLPKLTADNIVASPASLDSFWVREQQLLPIGGPYQIQSANAFTWYIEGGNGGSPDDTICALIRDDEYGEAGFEGFEAAAEENDIEIAEVVTFPGGEADFTTQIGALQSADCEMVLFVGLPTETSPAMTRAAQSSPPFTPQWIGQSPTWLGLFATTDLAPYLQENFVLASEGTEWGDTSVPGMAQMIEDAPADQAPDIYFSFGYSQARAVHQVLEAAVAAGDLSREGIIEAMNGIDTLTFDGLTGDYPYGAPEDRVPPRASTIFAVDPEAPGGLRVLERDIVSEAAENFEF